MQRVSLSASEIPRGGRLKVEVGQHGVVVFRLADDRFVAYEDLCLHQGGPVCSGGSLHPHLTAEIDEYGEAREYYKDDDVILACPWHGWEYDLETGELLVNRRWRLRAVEVRQEGDGLIIEARDK